VETYGGRTAGGRMPSMKVPLCSFSYVRYTPKRSHLERVGQRKGRTLTASTAEPLAQTLRRVALSKRLIWHPGMFLN